ncbi:MAG: phosphatidylinositol-4-phosphate 5-kinase, partial [Phocaeicola plebeius]
KRHGRGRYLYGDESVYEGGWLDGQPHGKGILYRKDGTKYSQQYANGQLL